jgi:hypothetical protein
MHTVLIINGKAYTYTFGGPSDAGTLREYDEQDMNSYLVANGYQRIGDGFRTVTQAQATAIENYLDANATFLIYDPKDYPQQPSQRVGGQPEGQAGTYSDSATGWDNFPIESDCVGPFQGAFANAGVNVYPGGVGLLPPSPPTYTNLIDPYFFADAFGMILPDVWLTQREQLVGQQNLFSQLGKLIAKLVGSLDPNDISGPQGVGTENLVADAGALTYQITFENLATASAPAQSVVITDQLDTSKVNLATFSLGPITFGNETLTPPAASSSYSTIVDLRPSNNLLVKVNAALDRTTGLATWTFTSLDPTTGQPTTNPLAGFLPPDVTPPEGDGSVFFSVQPSSGLVTGTQVTDSASVKFDTNAPIATSQWSNTIDATPPTSTVATLPATETDSHFLVSWSGSDVGSGIASYSIYYSDNGGPWTAWLIDTTATSDTFPGVPGHIYGFYSIATDNVGNVETAPTEAETITDVVCFLNGTYIATPNGETPVEQLAVGDEVMTHCGKAYPIIWIGRRRIDLTTHPRPETVAPVRIRRDAFAVGMPHRDLLVSPDHAIFVDGKLICARQLVNGSTIRPERDWAAVDYYHVELDSHAILLAEGLPAESYLDTGNRGFFANSGAPLVLHPDLTDEADHPTREAGSCAPFVWDEASVRPVWQRLADRAAATGLPVRATTTESDLHIRTTPGAGNHGKPIYVDSHLAIFVLPRGAEGVRLLSRAQSPTEARPWLDDRRRLGVRVKRILLRSGNELREVPIDHPDLTKGWWGIERDGRAMSRWTDGDAVLPLPAMVGPVMLELHLAGEMIYAVESEPESQAERLAA